MNTIKKESKMYNKKGFLKTPVVIIFMIISLFVLYILSPLITDLIQGALDTVAFSPFERLLVVGLFGMILLIVVSGWLFKVYLATKEPVDYYGESEDEEF
jgi:small-conductance mechanosensitive channel